MSYVVDGMWKTVFTYVLQSIASSYFQKINNILNDALALLQMRLGYFNYAYTDSILIH